MKKKIIVSILAVVFSLLFAVTVFAGCTSFEDSQLPSNNNQTNGGMVMNDNIVGNGIMLLSTPIPLAQYAEYGIAPVAETAKQLTATITPADATNKEVDWSIAWKNANSTWAQGKSVTSYVTVTPTSDGALTANVSCLQAFGEQIIITVTTREYAEINATCTVDYKQKYLGTSTSLSNTVNVSCPIDFSTTVDGGTITTNIPNSLTATTFYFVAHNFTLNKSDTYTIPLSGTATFEYYVKPTEDFISRLNMENTMGGYSMSVSTDWKRVTSAYVDDVNVKGHDMVIEASYESVSSIFYYLSFLAGNIYAGARLPTDQYVGFVDASNGVADALYGDKIHFQIKIVTEVEGETYETITNVRLNSVDLSVHVSDVQLDNSSLVF